MRATCTHCIHDRGQGISIVSQMLTVLMLCSRAEAGNAINDLYMNQYQVNADISVEHFDGIAGFMFSDCKLCTCLRAVDSVHEYSG